jgi:uncharacterized protein with NAD-binding domain and iron-sulfur cluster
VSETKTRQKIAVLGGGLGSLTTVYGLTSEPGWRDKYDITVYQMGWRLGGKGASGRNRQQNMRIEEHGLHIWMGFYQNAFQMMQACYAERARIDDRDGRINVLRNWDDAFKPQSFMVIDECIDGTWSHWPMQFPTNPGVPGDGDPMMTPWQMLVTALRLLQEHFASSPYAARTETHPDITGTRHGSLLQRVRGAVDHVEHVLVDVLKGLELGVLVSSGLFIEHAIAAAERMAGRDHTADSHRHLAWLLKEFRAWFSSHAQADVDRSTAARHLWTQMDVALTMVAGALEDGVLLHGFEVIDDEEFRAWLRRHGASEMGINNALNDSLYEGAFAYVGGDQQQPNMGAGAVTQSFFRLYLGYKGAVSYKMQAGMGDVVFAPLYTVLKERGVRFEFFHKVNALRYDTAGNAIARVECERQVRLERPYDPLIRVNDLDAWPSEPNYEFIRDGAELAAAIAAGTIALDAQGSPSWKDAEPVTLQRGRDYDLLVLGISIAALKYVAAEVIAARPEWQRMIENVLTVRTQGVQLWFMPDLAQAGWSMASPCLVNYAQPCAAWLDASQVLCREVWPAGEAPGSLAYLCSTLPDDVPELQETARAAFDKQRQWEHTVQSQATAWLQTAVPYLWPGLASQTAPGVDWDRLAAPAALSGAARMDAQFFRANIDASERYVLSVAGSARHRLRADQSGIDGLYLTGDWIANGFNVGCVESTAIAGLQCSRALAGYPQAIVGERFMRL